MQKPFLKWAGNKLPIIHRIQELLPPGEMLIEPFVGGGALFANADYPEYWINDANRDLICVYLELQTNVEAFIATCSALFTVKNNTENRYYALRNEFNRAHDPALFVYLNKHGYHGLCRYNKSGEFNAPYGFYKNPALDVQAMRFYAAKLQGAAVSMGDFSDAIDNASRGDIVYCDPPYDGLSETADFTAYCGAGFSQHEQVRLTTVALRAQARGATVLISNHNTPFIRTLYQGAEIIEFGVKRNMAAVAENRIEAPELLALFSPK